MTAEADPQPRPQLQRSVSVLRRTLTAASDPSSVEGQYVRQLGRHLSRGPSRLLSSSSLREDDDDDEEQRRERRQNVEAAAPPPTPDDVDRERLRRSLSEAGRDALGVGAAEVWVFDDDPDSDSSGMLVRPPGGWWRSPSVGARADAAAARDASARDALRALEDTDDPGYVAAFPVSLGVDLAGVLWAEARGGSGGGGGGAHHLHHGAFPWFGNFGHGRGGTTRQSFIKKEHNGRRISNDETKVQYDEEKGGIEVRSSFDGKEKGGASGSEEPWKDNDESKAANLSILSNTPWPDDARSGGRPKQVKQPANHHEHHLLNRLTKSFDPRATVRVPHLHLPRNPLWHTRARQEEEALGDHRRRARGDEFTGAAAGGGSEEEDEDQHALLFRDIQSLLMDPLTPKTPRMALLRRAGFSRVAGVPFESHGTRGIVLYYIPSQQHNNDGRPAAEQRRRDETEEEEATADAAGGGLTSLPNQLLMVRSADSIGLALSTAQARRACLALKMRQKQRRQKETTASSLSSGTNRTEVIGDEEGCIKDGGRSAGPCADVARRVCVGARKCRGNERVQVPPAPGWTQALWTLTGCFLSLLLLSGFEAGVSALSPATKSFPFLPPMGALVALQYGLTAAPASQPRNAVHAQLVGGAIAVSSTYVSESMLPRWTRRALAPAIAVAANSKLGVIHPPAGAAAVLLSSMPGGAAGRGGECMALYGLILAATILSILPAMVINNVSSTRQYPTYWKLWPTRMKVSDLCTY